MRDLMTDRTAIETATPSVLPWAYPLDEFYAQAGLPLPVIGQIRGEDMPEPYRSLLVHQSDMTPMLEKFHGAKIHVRVLRRDQCNGFYLRGVVLEKNTDNTPVEFGAIKINLSLFKPKARQLILDEREPLGHILADSGVVHTSRPKAFLKIEADELISRALRVGRQTLLYGRRNTLFDPRQQPLAEIVEILPAAALPG